MSLLPLALRHLCVGRAMHVTLGGLVAVTAFLAAAAPRALNTGFDKAARDTIEQAAPAVKDIQVAASPRTIDSHPLLSLAGLQSRQDAFYELLTPSLQSEVARASHVVSTADLAVSEPPLKGEQPIGIRHIALQHRSELADHIRYVAGSPPDSTIGEVGHRGQELPLISVAFSAQNADALQVGIGDMLVLSREERGNSTDPVVAIRVTGLYEPLDPTASYWALDPSPIVRRVVLDAGEAPPDLYGKALTDPEVYESWHQLVPPTAVFRFELDPQGVTASEVSNMRTALESFLSRATRSSDGQLVVDIDTGLGNLLATFAAGRSTASAVVSIGVAGLLAVALTVIALAALLAAERRRESLILLRARGGSLGQIIGVTVTEMALVAVPAAAIGFTVATVFIPARWSVASALLSALVVAMAVLLVTGIAARQHRTARRDDRTDLVAVRPTARRVVLEGLLVLLSVIGVILLHRRGLTTAATERGTDPFLVTVPVLLGFAVGLLALRAYPYPLRALGHTTAQRRGAVGFLGVARASRQTLGSALPIVVLLIGLALGVFGSVIDRGLTEAQARQSWQEVGAEIRAERSNLDDAAINAVRALPGVTGVLPAFVDIQAAIFAEGRAASRLTLIAVDLDAYRRLVAGAPAEVPPADLRPTGSDEWPALLSPAVEPVVRDRDPFIVTGSTTTSVLDIAGTVDQFPGFSPRTNLAVIPYEPYAQATGARLPNTLFIAGAGISTTDVGAVLDDGTGPVRVRSRVDQLEGISKAPFVEQVRLVFRLGLIAVAGFCMLALLLALVIGARARGRAISQLRTLGLSRRQARWLEAFEVTPLVGAAMVAGVALGLALPRLVGSAVDLRSFTGGQEVTSYPLDPATIGVLAGGLVVIVVIAIIVNAWITTRRGLGSVLTLGE